MEPQKNNWGLFLGLGIAELLCCCWPIGIAVIVMAVQAKNAYEQMNFVDYEKKAKTAKILLIVGAALGVVLNAVIFLAQVLPALQQ